MDRTFPQESCRKVRLACDDALRIAHGPKKRGALAEKLGPCARRPLGPKKPVILGCPVWREPVVLGVCAGVAARDRLSGYGRIPRLPLPRTRDTQTTSLTQRGPRDAPPSRLHSPIPHGGERIAAPSCLPPPLARPSHVSCHTGENEIDGNRQFTPRLSPNSGISTHFSAKKSAVKHHKQQFTCEFMESPYSGSRHKNSFPVAL